MLSHGSGQIERSNQLSVASPPHPGHLVAMVIDPIPMVADSDCVWVDGAGVLLEERG
jgi:hypothetical protein